MSSTIKRMNDSYSDTAPESEMKHLCMGGDACGSQGEVAMRSRTRAGIDAKALPNLGQDQAVGSPALSLCRGMAPLYPPNEYS
eukprot:5545625-Pyramimonas_sp.AAC.1